MRRLVLTMQFPDMQTLKVWLPAMAGMTCLGLGAGLIALFGFFVEPVAAEFSVGVATVDIPAGTSARGLYMDTQESVEVEALQEIPLGHKIAMADFSEGDTILKYGHDIGRVVAPIQKGQHVHIHNLKTKRW